MKLHLNSTVHINYDGQEKSSDDIKDIWPNAFIEVTFNLDYLMVLLRKSSNVNKRQTRTQGGGRGSVQEKDFWF